MDKMKAITILLGLFLVGIILTIGASRQEAQDAGSKVFYEPSETEAFWAYNAQKNREPRYPDFSQADPVPDGIWNCIDSSYEGDQYWTASGPNAVFACGPLLQTNAMVCKEIKINSPGVDDECIID